MKGLNTYHGQHIKITTLWIYGIIIVGTLLLSGCGAKQPSPDDPLQKKWSQDDYGPTTDDSVTLTPTELAALKSTGQVDKRVNAKGMQDVTVQYKHYVRKGRSTVERSAKRAEKYLAHSRKVFRQRGLPEELAYLAMIESGYNPTAVSPAGAAGAWQFMPFTGSKYGLTQDWWMDERRDPYKSAEAAADYLKKLHGDFKDWHLAIAAYNAGEGKIGRALDKTGTVTFFKLSEQNHTLDDKAQLREETKQYVPRFLAFCKIMRNLESLGFSPIDPNRVEAVVPITVAPGTDLMALSRATGMEWQEFYSYNAAYKRYVSPTDRSSVVYVPQQRQQAAQAYLRNPRANSYAGWKPYTVRKGDTWSTISSRSTVPVTILRSANKVGNLKPGTVVLLPGSDSLREMPAIAVAEKAAPKNNSGRADRDSGDKSVGNSAPLAVAAATPRGESRNTVKEVAKKGPQPASPSTHTLQAGDTLSRIASQYNVSVRELMAANDMEDANRIRQGQVLRIPTGKEPQPVAVANAKKPAKQEQVQGSTGSLGRGAAPAPKKQATYTVQPGDTLWGIARKHNVQARDLMQWNKSDGKSPLRPGDVLVVDSDT